MPPGRRSSRQSSSEKQEVKKAGPKQEEVQSQWTMLVEDSILENSENGEDRPVICKLRHPKTDSCALFMFANEGKDVFEAIKHKEEFRSWFFGNHVQQDGGMLMMTPVDPLFLVMPYLMKAELGGKYMTLDQIVVDEDFPECNRILNCSGLDELGQITEVKGDVDLRAYKFDKDKTMSWLKLKTENVADRLQEKNIHVSTGGAHSAMFVRTKKEESVDRDLYIKYACGIVSDYLPPSISNQLRDYLGIANIEEPAESPVVEPPAKRAKLEEITPTEDYSKTNGAKKQNSKDLKLTGAQKKLSKVDKSGMKSISSFFSPKSKT